MLLEPERPTSKQPEHSSRAVRTRRIGTDQLRLLKTLHSKATGTSKAIAQTQAGLSKRSDLVEVRTLYNVMVLVSHSFVTKFVTVA
jgi:hypothetical protein